MAAPDRRWEITPKELEQLRDAIRGIADHEALPAALAALASWALALVDAAAILIAVRRRTNEPLLVEAAAGRATGRLLGRELGPVESRALGVPIRIGDEDAGLVVARPRRGQRFADGDAELLRLLASQAAAALSQHRADERVRELYHRERRRAEQLGAAAELDRTFLRFRRIGDILDFAVAVLKSRFGYDRVAIYLREQDQLDYLLRAHAGTGPPLGARLDLAERTPAAWSALSGEPQLVAGGGDPGRRAPADEPSGQLAVPIGDDPDGGRGQPLGVLAIISRDGLDEHDLALAQSIADDVAIALENLRLAAKAREDAAAAERARLARELHDDTAQQLVAIGRQLDLLRMELEGAPHAAKVEAIQDLVDAALVDVRRISRDLRPTILEDLGLASALEALAADAARSAPPAVVFSLEGSPRRLPARIELAVYRIVQEALANALRHAEPSRVEVRVAFEHGRVRAEVRDDGRGFARPINMAELQRGGGLGVVGMRERAAEIGGRLEMETAPGSGTTVRVVVADGEPARNRMAGT